MGSSLRTCIGCRRRAAATELVRLVLVDGQVRAGARSAHPGRGASIHPAEVCVAAAVKSHTFDRAFRGPILVSGDAVRALVSQVEVAHVMQQSRAGRNP